METTSDPPRPATADTDVYADKAQMWLHGLVVQWQKYEVTAHPWCRTGVISGISVVSVLGRVPQVAESESISSLTK
jgi:hypothetical protein